eukprot:GHVU01023145.1.p1 GENE.GHVU01023145.1~~GHVU01023145.1.p1  ORF type:complete len:117 (+),score=4.65 GHVU01023145.1:529-879(+)
MEESCDPTRLVGSEERFSSALEGVSEASNPMGTWKCSQCLNVERLGCEFAFGRRRPPQEGVIPAHMYIHVCPRASSSQSTPREVPNGDTDAVAGSNEGDHRDEDKPGRNKLRRFPY